MNGVDRSKVEAISQKLECVHGSGRGYLLVYNGRAFDSDFRFVTKRGLRESVRTPSFAIEDDYKGSVAF
jgi:hypothetical protein